MVNFLVLVLRLVFALIIAIATIITIIIVGPFWLILWVWKQLEGKNQRN